MTRHAWTVLCWAVIALGLLLACRGPKPEPPAPPPHDFGEASEEKYTGGQTLSNWGRGTPAPKDTAP